LTILPPEAVLDIYMCCPDEPIDQVPRKRHTLYIHTMQSMQAWGWARGTRLVEQVGRAGILPVVVNDTIFAALVRADPPRKQRRQSVYCVDPLTLVYTFAHRASSSQPLPTYIPSSTAGEEHCIAQSSSPARPCPTPTAPCRSTRPPRRRHNGSHPSRPSLPFPSIRQRRSRSPPTTSCSSGTRSRVSATMCGRCA